MTTNAALLVFTLVILGAKPGSFAGAAYGFDDPPTTQKSEEDPEKKNAEEKEADTQPSKEEKKPLTDDELEALKARAIASAHGATSQPAPGAKPNIVRRPAVNPGMVKQPGAGAPAVDPKAGNVNENPAALNPIDGGKSAPGAKPRPTMPIRPGRPNTPAPGTRGGQPAVIPANQPPKQVNPATTGAPNNPGMQPGQVNTNQPNPTDAVNKRGARRADRRQPPTGRPGTTPNPAGNTPPTGMPGNPGVDPNAGGASTAEGGDAPVVTNTKTKMLVFQIDDPHPEERTYRFQYVDMPWQDVLSDFSRVSGLPLVNKPDPPIPGTLTYFSNDEYTFVEALHKLNELLQLNPLNNYVILRKPKYMTVDRIPDLVRRIPPEKMFNTFEDFVAADLDPYDVCLTKYKVKNGWLAYQVIEQFRSMFSDTYGTEIIGPDEIQLTGLVKEHMLWNETIGKLTQEPPDPEDPRDRLIVALKAQKAAVVQTILNQLFQIAPVAPRARPGAPAGIDQDMNNQKQLTIVPDVTNNVLYIRGPKPILAEIQETIQRIDVGEFVPSKQEVVKLQNANSQGIVTTLKPIFMKQMQDLNKTQIYIPEEMKASMDVDIFADSASNSIIIVGGEEGVARAMKMVQQYDVAPETFTDIIELQHADAQDVANTVLQTLQSKGMAKGVPGGAMAQLLPQSSSKLLVVCTPQDLKDIKLLIEKLDVPDDEEPQEHTVQLTYAKPSIVAQTIMQVMGGSARPAPRAVRRGAAGRVIPGQVNRPGQPVQQMAPQMMTTGEDGLKLIPNDDTRTLFVYCADKDWEKINGLIQKLDTLEATAKPMLHTISLKKANPEDVASMVNSMYPPNPGSMAPQIVTADVYNNTIQIFARPDFIEEVVPLIETLDINATSELTVIKLEHCKADVIAPILAQAVPGATAVTTPQVNRGVPVAQPVKRPMRQPMVQGVTQQGDTSVRIVAEPVTNSLLVTAPPKELEQIQGLVAQMEAAQLDIYGKIIQEIVPVQNRPADEIATTLTTLLGNGPASTQRTPGAAPGVSGQLNPAAEDLKVVANGDRLILKGPEKQIEQAKEILAQIDVPDQTAIAMQYRVDDAETVEQKLRTMLAGRVAATSGRPMPVSRRNPGRPVQAGQNVQQVVIPSTNADSGIQIYADTYKNALLIKALPKEFVEIEAMLKVILSEPPPIDVNGHEPPSDQFFMVKLKYKSAWDMGFTLEDLINTDDRSKVEFLEGPTEKDMLVRGYKPGQEETIRKFIDMYDVPEHGSDKGYLALDKEMTRERVQMLMELHGNKTEGGRPVKFVGSGAGNRIQIIDIHAGEEDSNSDSNSAPAGGEGAKPADQKPAGQSSPVNDKTQSSAAPIGIRPSLLPFWMAYGEMAAAVSQTAPADSGSTSPEESSHSLRYLGAQAMQGGTQQKYDSLTVIEDPNTGRIIVVGPPEDLEWLQGILDDVDDDDEPTVIRVFPMKYTDVNAAAQLLEKVFNQQAAPTPAAPQQRGRGQQQPGGQPQNDPKTGQPMPQQPMPQAPAQPQGPQLGRKGSGSGGSVLKVVPNDRMKSLFVIAKLSDIPLIVEVLREIDKKGEPEIKNLRFFRLTNLEAEQVIQNLREILGINAPAPATPGGRGRPGQPQQGQPQGGNQQQIVGLPGADASTEIAADKIKLTAEPQTNTIIATGPTETLDYIGKLIEELEELENGTAWIMRRVTLENARATDIADIVDDLARELLPGGGAPGGQPGQGGPGGGRGGRRAGVNRVLVEADSRTNSVIIAGLEKDLKVCEDIIKDLDIKEDNAVRQFTVKGVPSDLVPSLKELFISSRSGGRGGPPTDIIITSSDPTKTILVKAPAPQMKEIEEQIVKMDAKVEAIYTPREIKLKVANAETLATKLTDIYAAGGRRGGQPEVTFKGVKSNSTIYVRCSDEIFPQIQKIVESMDTAPTDIQVHRFPLKHAVAQDVLQRVQTLMAGALKPGGGSDLNIDFVGITADPRTNSLVLVGGPTSALLLQSLISEVDVAPETPMVRSTAAYTLPLGQDVNQVTQNINQMFQGVSIPTTGVEAPKVTANMAANLIIVEANQEQQKKIKEGIIDPILNAVDEKKDYVYQVQNAQASQLANTLMSQLRQTMPNMGGKFPVSIVGDDNANTLLINATPKHYEQVMAMVTPLDVQPQDRTTKAFRVKYVAPWTMANIVNQMFVGRGSPSERVNASFEDGTMSIVVTANKKNMEAVTKLIEETDQPGVEKETRYYQIKQARADDVQRALDASLRGLVPQQRGLAPYTITADPASNMLVVTTDNRWFEQVEKLIQELDVPALGVDQVVRKSVKLTYADPGAVANNIRQSYQTQNRNPSPKDVVIITENWTTNSVFITASEEKMASIESDIATMDTPDGGGRSNHVIEVKNANPNDVAQAVQALFQDVFRMKRQQTPPTIKAIPGTTKIIAYASSDEIKQIEDLVEKVDSEGGRVVHAVTMPELVPAKTVSDTINQLFGTRGNDGPKSQYHEPTNTLLVSATDAEYERINTQLIEPLSKTEATGIPQFYQIPLKYAPADEVAKTLQEFFDKKSGVSTNRNMPPWMRNQNSSEARDNQVTVMAEASSNTLLVFATDNAKKLIDELLENIDKDRTEGQSIEMVPLQYVDAKEMIDVMTEVLKVQKRTSDQQDNFIPWWMDGRKDDKKDEAVLAGGMRLKAIESSNSVIVSGKKDSVAEAIAKIKELDVPTAGMEPVRYTVKNGSATDKVEVLKKLFVDGQQQSGNKSNAQKLTIVAEDASNQILVRGKASEVNSVIEMAKNLDDSTNAGETGMQFVPVPPGQNIDQLAIDVQNHINEVQRNMGQQIQGYKPKLVTVTANARANLLMVSGPKSSVEEVEKAVQMIVSRGPASGLGSVLIPISNKLSSDQIRELINQMQQGANGGSSSGSRPSGGRSSGGGRRGPRGDANWTRDGRYQQMMEDAENGGRTRPNTRGVKATTIAATMPVMMMQLALSTAVAQTPPAKPEAPRSHTIRPMHPTTQPAAQKKPTVTSGLSISESIREHQPAEKAPSPAANEKQANGGAAAAKPGVPFNQILDSTTQPADFENWSPEAMAALRLTGADVTVTDAGPGMIYVEGLQSDVNTIRALVKLLENNVPDKEVEYFRLKNASATDLAPILSQVLEKVAPQGAGQIQPADKVDIIPDSRTNGLYVAASKENMARARGLIERADEEQPLEKNAKAFTFKNRRVSEAGEVLKKLAETSLKQKGLSPTLISIEIDPQTNTVFVTAGESDLKRVESWVEMLDAPMPEEDDKSAAAAMGQANIMVVPLRVAKADTLATLLSGLLEKAATGDTPMKDFIRRLRLLDEQGQPLATVDLNKPIFVFGDPDSNALLIASTIENCLIMKQVALAFDKEPSKSEVASRVFQLQYADAKEVETRLKDVLTDSEQLTARPGINENKGVPEGQPGALVYKAVVKADARTNQVVVVGRPEAVEIISDLITKLDVKGAGVMPFEIVKLEFASATALATALTDMLDKRKETISGEGDSVTKGETIIITPDARSQSLIIAAKRERMEELKDLIKKLDVKASALVENIRTIQLKKGTATDLAEKLKDLWTQTRDQREGGEQGGLGLEIPAIVADERSNSLIVSASLSDFESIKGVVDKIENLELNPMANIYIVRMKYNSASQLAEPLQSLFQARAEMATANGEVRPEDKVSIEVDEATNSLLVAASRTNFDVLMQKVKELDVEIGIMGQIEFFRGQNVNATEVKDVIDKLFEGKLFKPGSSRTGDNAETREKVTTVVDDRANVLIVTASPENMAIVREIFERMNSVTSPWDPVETRVVQLQHGDSVQVADKVQKYFDDLKDASNTGGESGGNTNRWTVKIISDEKRNRVIIGGSKDGIERAIKLVEQLDVPPGDSSQIIKVYKVNEAPAQKIAEMITNIFQERNQPREGGGDSSVPDIKVTVESNDAARTLVVNASKLDHVLIENLIKELDRPSSLLDMVKVFPLVRANAAKVKDILEQVYQSSGTGDGASQTVAVVEDARTNSVVVAAPPGELSNVETIISRLDQSNVTGVVEVGVFPCDNEDAEKMAGILNQIMMGEGGEGGTTTEDEDLRSRKSQALTFVRKGLDGTERRLQTLRENVQITFNTRSNSVIVVAPPDTLRLIRELIGKLDGIEKKEVLVKVFLLRNADATKTVEILEKMFAQDEQSSDQADFQQGREMNVEGGAGAAAGVPSAFSQGSDTRKGTFGRPKTTFVPDERTNAIIAAGWPEDIGVVGDIIDQLDAWEIRDRDTFVYTASNMKAVDMQSALEQYFQAEKSIFDGQESVSPQQKMEREVSIVAHEESNQLIVSTSPRMKSTVLSVIESLDAPPPQVMIQVMIAEVTLDDRFEMGLEFALQELRFSETAVPGGNGVLQSSHFDVVGGTDLGAAGSGLGGFSFTITGEDFNFLVRALQSDSRLEVIQRPMIMCQDNQVATISIGSSVPIPQGTTSGGTTGGTLQTTVTYQDVGVILDVEPNINPDGWVYLKVAPEISDIADSSIQIGPGVFAPIFTKRKADTFVAVKDGETVVIGGLITTSDSESESKVPLLGDIPGLGALFRTTTRVKRKTELLIALTPRIVRTVEDGYRLSIEERDKSGVITDEMKASPFFEKLRLTPESEDEISSIETIPDDAGGPATGESPVAPTQMKETPTDKGNKYGPQPQKYGPVVPSETDDSDVIARRPSRSASQTAVLTGTGAHD